MDKYKLVDLFAGTGGFSCAFKSSKVQCVFANDFSKESELMYNLNHDIKLTKKDINDVNISDIPNGDIITAGFPCQPFSIAGEARGFDDIRSNVFWKIIEIMDCHKPNIVLLENVKNLQSHDGGRTFKIIYDKLSKLNYYVKYKILDTSIITRVPQHRERIFILCFKDKSIYDKFDFDFPIVLSDPIINYLEKKISNKYYYTDRYKVYDVIKNSCTKHIETGTIYQYRRYYVRENTKRICPTLTCNMGTGGHNVPILVDSSGIRKLTPRECFNLQGFPRNYKLPNVCDGKLYSLAGNAVSIPVVKLIANKLFSII